MNTLKYPNIKLSGNNTRFFKDETKNNSLFTPTNKNNKSKHNEFQQIKISNWIFGMKALIFRTTSEIY